MGLKTVKDLDLNNKRVLVRCDFNVPLKEGVITDDTRILSAAPTLKYILEQPGTSLVVMSHLGRPKGEKKPELSLAPVATRLAEVLGTKVAIASDVIGDDVKAQVQGLGAGDVLLLENVRYYNEETKNDADFAKKLAEFGDVYVNDAFGTAHRAHASTEGVSKFLPSAAGFLIEKEVKFFGGVLENTERPAVAIVGGAKVSSKIAVLESLLPRVSTLIIGGGMAYTFLKVLGKEIGTSLCEDDFMDTAKSIMDKAAELGVEILLPEDHVVAPDKFHENAAAEYVPDINVPPVRWPWTSAKNPLKKSFPGMQRSQDGGLERASGCL
jgi:phosphoglycerate kinase